MSQLKGMAVFGEGSQLSHIDLGELFFCDSAGYLSLNCGRCGDSEEGTLITYIEAGDNVLEKLAAVRAHECEGS